MFQLLNFFTFFIVLAPLVLCISNSTKKRDEFDDAHEDEDIFGNMPQLPRSKIDIYVHDWIRKALEMNETQSSSDDMENPSLPPISKDLYYVGMKWIIKKYCFNMSSEKACMQVVLKPHVYEEIPLKFRLFRKGTDLDSKVKDLEEEEGLKGYSPIKVNDKYHNDDLYKNRYAFDQFYEYLSKRKKKQSQSSNNHLKNGNSIGIITEHISLGALGDPYAKHVSKNLKSRGEVREKDKEKVSTFMENFEERPVTELSDQIIHESLEKVNKKMDNEDDEMKSEREEQNEIKVRSKRSAKKKKRKHVKKTGTRYRKKNDDKADEEKDDDEEEEEEEADHDDEEEEEAGDDDEEEEAGEEGEEEADEEEEEAGEEGEEEADEEEEEAGEEEEEAGEEEEEEEVANEDDEEEMNEGKRNVENLYYGNYGGFDSSADDSNNYNSRHQVPADYEPDTHDPSIHDPEAEWPVMYDANQEELLADVKNVNQEEQPVPDQDAVPEYTSIQDWNRCQLPPPRKTSEVLCKVLPKKMVCKLYCIHGHTFTEGITRETVCELGNGMWSKKFEECLPFVDCTLKLKTAGYLKCTTNTVQTGPRCQIECQNYATKPATTKRTHQCDTTGRWDPPLPHCVEREGIDVVQPPPSMSHRGMDYPE